MTLDQMLRLGMRPRRTMFLVVMEWPEAFVLPWRDLTLRDVVDDQLSLYDVLAEPVKTTPATVAA